MAGLVIRTARVVLLDEGIDEFEVLNPLGKLLNIIHHLVVSGHLVEVVEVHGFDSTCKAANRNDFICLFKYYLYSWKLFRIPIFLTIKFITIIFKSLTNW